MKFTINTSDLQKEVEVASLFTGKASALTMMSYALLTVEGDCLTIVATNGKAFFRTMIPTLNTESDGSCCVVADKLNTILKSLGDVVTLAYDSNALHISQEKVRAKVKLKALDASKYKEYLDGITLAEPQVESIDIPTAILLGAFQKVIFAANKDNTNKRFLCGIHMEHSDIEGYSEMVCTDGRILANTRIQTAEPFPYIIIPSEAIAIINKSMSASNTVSIKTKDNILSISNTNRLCVFSLINDNYPTWKKVIPSTLSDHIVVETKVLSKAIDIISIMADNKVKDMVITIGKDTMTLQAESDFGQSTQTIDIADSTIIGNDAVAFLFSTELFSAIIKAISTDTATLSFNKPTMPMLIQSDSDTQYVCMPKSR